MADPVCAQRTGNTRHRALKPPKPKPHNPAQDITSSLLHQEEHHGIRQ